MTKRKHFLSYGSIAIISFFISLIVLSVILSSVSVCIYFCLLLHLSVFLVGLCLCLFDFHGLCCLRQRIINK